MILWDKNISTEERILSFTTGMDPVFDLQLAPYDVLGSMAHAIMLSEVGLIGKGEAGSLLEALVPLYEKACAGSLSLDKGIEDIHSQVELILTQQLGDLEKDTYGKIEERSGDGGHKTISQRSASGSGTSHR